MSFQTSILKQRLVITIAAVALWLGARQLPGAQQPGAILIGAGASAVERYGARELQRYLYQV